LPQSPELHSEHLPQTESQSELRWCIRSLLNFAPLSSECFWIVSQIPTFPPRTVRGAAASFTYLKTCVSICRTYRQIFLGLSRAGSAQASAANAHIRHAARAQGRFRFDGNREVLTKLDDRVASSPERRRGSASARMRLSPRLLACARLNRNVEHLALESSLGPAQRAFGSSSTDSPEHCSNNAGRSTPPWGTPSQKEHSS
jgi:hypothetical protein